MVFEEKKIIVIIITRRYVRNYFAVIVHDGRLPPVVDEGVWVEAYARLKSHRCSYVYLFSFLLPLLCLNRFIIVGERC